ncbi:hypothetical protein ZWY2020_032939 [Hordeum vulgare]|nr:hypothetical protein ZWY2020_032939 [Hordeum vulgare]
MDQSIGWQKAVQDLASDNQEIREQLREITGWFPSIEMMRNLARGLIKVQRTTDLMQRARWWMYRSSRMMASQPDPTRLASRTERVTDVVLALPAAVLDPEVQIILPVFTSGNKKKKREPKKPVVGVVRHSERLKNLKNN